jgi:lipid A 3-O-deacylase
MKRNSLGLFLLTVGFLFAMVSSGDAVEPEAVRAATGEWAVLTGYGITHRGFGDTRTQVQTVDLIGRFGWFLSREIGVGSWYQGRHELLTELPLHLVVDPKTAVITGAYFLGSWKFTSLGPWLPYAFAGGGIVYTNLDLPTMGSSLNFSYQGGTGLQYLLRPELALMGEYRYHHISNAGTAVPNEPLNSSHFLVGISRFF